MSHINTNEPADSATVDNPTLMQCLNAFFSNAQSASDFNDPRRLGGRAILPHMACRYDPEVANAQMAWDVDEAILRKANTLVYRGNEDFSLDGMTINSDTINGDLSISGTSSLHTDIPQGTNISTNQDRVQARKGPMGYDAHYKAGNGQVWKNISLVLGNDTWIDAIRPYIGDAQVRTEGGKICGLDSIVEYDQKYTFVTPIFRTDASFVFGSAHGVAELRGQSLGPGESKAGVTNPGEATLEFSMEFSKE